MGQSSGSSFARCLGFSVAEVTIILTSLSILTAAAAPAVDDYVKQAKLVKAHHDVSTLSVTLIRLLSDTAADANIPNGWATTRCSSPRRRSTRSKPTRGGVDRAIGQVGWTARRPAD
jgi:Tfp pilus assembly major pilin PilA